MLIVKKDKRNPNNYHKVVDLNAPGQKLIRFILKIVVGLLLLRYLLIPGFTKALIVGIDNEFARQDYIMDEYHGEGWRDRVDYQDNKKGLR